MSKHTSLGKLGENIAANFLKEIKVDILHRNLRIQHKEVDIIGWDNGILIFYEIKTRTNFKFGYPEESVNKIKQEHLKTAAILYLEKEDLHCPIRFDIISILMDKLHNTLEIKHIKDAFY